MEPVVTPPGAGRLIAYGGQHVRVICDVGDFAVAEFTVAAGFPGPLPHIHHDFDEAFHILDGSLQVLVRQETITAAPGAFVLASRGTRHAFSNPGDRPVRLLGYWAPRSGLALVEDIGRLLTAGGPPDAAAMAGTYRRHNSELA